MTSLYIRDVLELFGPTVALVLIVLIVWYALFKEERDL